MSDTIIAAIIGALAVIIAANIGRRFSQNRKDINDAPKLEEKKPIQMAIAKDNGAAINVNGNNSSVTLNSNNYYPDEPNAWKKERGMMTLCPHPFYWMPKWAKDGYYDFGMETHRFLEFVPMQNSLIYHFCAIIIDGELVSHPNPNKMKGLFWLKEMKPQ